jgi:hypothetical protein
MMRNPFGGIKGVDGADVSYPGADGGAVGGSSRRERYSVPGTTPLGKRSLISYHFAELVLEITVFEMFLDRIN